MSDMNPEFTYGEPLEYGMYDEMNDYYRSVEKYGRSYADDIYGYKYANVSEPEFINDNECEGCKTHSTLIKDHQDADSGCLMNRITCEGCLNNQPNQLAHMDEGGCLYHDDEVVDVYEYEFMHKKKWQRQLEENKEVSKENPNNKWDIVSILPTLNEDYTFLETNKDLLNWKLVTMNPCFTIQDMIDHSHLPWDMNWICMNPHMNKRSFIKLLPIMVQSPDSWMSIKLSLQLNKNISNVERKEYYEFTLDQLVGEGKKYQYFRY